MPIYEYSCRKCGRTIEIIQKFSDPVAKKHAGCGGALTKLISQSAFQLKGTGWYVTDYARKPKGGESDGAKDSKAKDSKKEAKETPSKGDGSAKESTTSPKTAKSGES